VRVHPINRGEGRRKKWGDDKRKSREDWQIKNYGRKG